MATLIKQVQGFVRNQSKAGAAGLALLNTCIDHMFEHGDWTPLAWLVAKSDAKDGAIFRSIIRETTAGVSMVSSSKEAKEQPSGILIKVASNAGPTDKMPILRELVAEGVSFRSNAVKERLMDKKATEFNLKAYAKRLQNKLAKEGCTVADLLDAFEPVKPAGKTAEPAAQKKVA